MKKPIDMLLDQIGWTEIPSEGNAGSDLPFATHKGLWHLGEATLRVYQLNDGRRIIDCDDLDALFGGTLSELTEHDSKCDH